MRIPRAHANIHFLDFILHSNLKGRLNITSIGYGYGALFTYTVLLSVPVPVVTNF